MARSCTTRRSQWTIYRLEWEVLSNFEHYRGTQFVPVFTEPRKELKISRLPMRLYAQDYSDDSFMCS